MKHRLKGLLALVLSLVMVFALATNAWAVDYNIWVSGTQVNDANAANVLAGDAANDGKVSYDAANNTLTLNGVTISGSGDVIKSNENLTLQLLGVNEVESNSGGAGIFVDGGTLTIDGTGSLTASGTSSGISADNVTIESGTVTATGTNGDGIYANKVTISGGTVTATGSNDYGYGIYALEDNSNGGDITISNGTVTATGGSAGMYADNKVTIEGGTVTATGGSAGAGIGADNAITISGADTNVTVGCETGLVADTVSILDDSTVSIDADNTAIDCTTLNMGGNWYQWKGDDNQLHVSSDGDEHKLDATKAATTKTLIIEKISTGTPGNTNPYPPIIYNPTPTPEPEKVDSAKTFDAGIGLYIGMSVLSATGSAFLFKKKD